MSIADFYVEYGIDPSDPNHMDRVCALGRGYDYDEGEEGAESSGDGINNGDSTYVQTHNGFGVPNGMIRYSLSEVPDPSRDELWASLCSDDRWRYKPISEEELTFCEFDEDFDFSDYWGEKASMKGIPPPKDMHRGALAPKWVFETKATKIVPGVLL